MRILLASALAGALIFPLGAAAGPAAAHDGRHDFDWNFGTWTTHIKRLAHPLSGSTTWLAYAGTVTVRPLLGGKANIEEIEADGPTHLELVDVRTYNPGSRQWRENGANSRDGTLEQPGIGAFVDGRGVFYDQEPFDGKAVLVRQTFFDVTSVSYAFEQAFSVDGGKTWEPNFVANLHRTSATAVARASPSVANHDFDFNEGIWTTHIRSLNSAANSDPSWLSLTGTVTIRKLWNGRAYVEQLDVPGKDGFAGVTLYLYNPHTRQWSQNYADVSDGAFESPMIGGFDGGRGELVSQDAYGGKTALLRGVWSNITPNAHEFEIDVSKDDGAKWQPVFVAHLTRKVADLPAAVRDGRHDGRIDK